MALQIVEYQTGAHAADEFEVMLESTANLYAAVGIGTRCAEIDADIAMFEYENLIAMIDEIINPKA